MRVNEIESLADGALELLNMAEPIKLTLGDGSIIVGRSLEEAFANLAKAKELVKTAPVREPRRTRSSKFDRNGNRVK
jgi:hypothetical protein